MSEGLTFPSSPSDGQTISFSFQHTGGDANNAVVTKTWSWNASRNAWVSNSGSGGGGGGEPIDTSVFVLNTGDEMTGSLVFTGNGKTAQFSSSGITLNNESSSFNFVVTKSELSSHEFTTGTDKILNITTDKTSTPWNGFNVTNQLAVGNEPVYINKNKHMSMPSYAGADHSLNGGVAGVSYQQDMVRFIHTDAHRKYPSEDKTYIRKIVSRMTSDPVWSGSNRFFLVNNVCCFIGNFSDAGRIKENAKGVVVQHGKFLRTPEIAVSSNTVEPKANTILPTHTIDGVFVSGLYGRKTQLLLGGYNINDNNTKTLKLVQREIPAYGGTILTDQVGGFALKNVIEERSYGLTTQDDIRKEALFNTVDGIDPIQFYNSSSGLTSVGATAALVFSFMDSEGESWFNDALSSVAFVDPICNGFHVLCSYNMEKAVDYENPNDSPLSNFINLYKNPDDDDFTFSRIFYENLTVASTSTIFSATNNGKYLVTDTLIEKFNGWNRLWSVYESPFGSNIARFHPTMNPIVYDNNSNSWKKGNLNFNGTLTGATSNYALYPHTLSYDPRGMTAWRDGINPPKCQYTFVQKGDEYYCDMDSQGATYYYNIYTGGRFEYNPSQDGIPLDACYNGSWTNSYSSSTHVEIPIETNTSDCNGLSGANITYTFPFVTYYKVRMSDGKIMDGPISAKLPIFDYNNSSVNGIKIAYNWYDGERAPIYSDYPTGRRYLSKLVNQMSANSCLETYDFTIQKKTFNVFGGSCLVYEANNERSMSFGIRCAIGPTGTLLGDITENSENRWRKMIGGLEWPGDVNIYDSVQAGPIQKHHSGDWPTSNSNYGTIGEMGLERFPILAGRIQDYISSSTNNFGWEFPRGHVVRWSGYSYDDRDGAGVDAWTSTESDFLNYQYYRKVFGVDSLTGNADKNFPNMELLTRVGYNRNLGDSTGVGNSNPRGALLALPLYAAQKIFDTAYGRLNIYNINREI